MGKYCSTLVLDAALNYIKNNAAQICACTTQPTSYTQAAYTYVTAKAAISSASFQGPGDGDVSGRKIRFYGESDISVTGSGTIQHIAIVSGSALLYVTTTSDKAVTTGDEIDIPEFNIEFRDPL